MLVFGGVSPQVFRKKNPDIFWKPPIVASPRRRFWPSPRLQPGEFLGARRGRNGPANGGIPTVERNPVHNHPGMYKLKTL